MSGLECIPLAAYCLMTGETAEKIKNRVKSGIWRQGTHVIKIPGEKDSWIDLTEVNQWVRTHAIPLTDEELGINWKALDEPSPVGKGKRKR
ncbi:excisionase [Pluralibacter gergoviae]|uniref:Excisionase n=1 Tax=Pluralibacter gergoviae TaxID=61647 RepID=A0AAW8HNK2_PLUGE|nr:excisionase [Pluralibacter gergoviae]EKV0931355.1 excisionase [Pluralibacter gergoviae]ELD4271525.1 excisionase [Pluralibacter gergoviae]ELD4277280.1 excisionase [Pluralibacter gergoviae]ELD4316449.1 excisionase [Pluralibacter gergoviae]ELD4341164.1 excisionase [Pluralibacter gergoviae]